MTSTVRTSRAAPEVWEETPAPGAWISRGSCRGAPTSLFFPDDAGRAHEAIRVCRRCPVRAECAAYALDIPGLEGIWGGLTEADRLRHRRRHADPVTPHRYPRRSGVGKGGGAHAHRCPR